MKNRVWAIVMVFVLLFTNFQGASYVFAHDTISVGYSFEQTYDEETNTVVIKGNGSEVPNNIQITSVKADDGTELNLEDPKYTAKENKEYSFLISYLVFTQDGENISSDAREETKIVSVTGIKEEVTTEEVTTEEDTSVEDETTITEPEEELKDTTVSKDRNIFSIKADDPYEKSVYNINIGVDIETGHSSYIAKLKLPKEVKISDDFKLENIESIKHVSSEVVDGANIYTITFNGGISDMNQTHIDVHIPFDQSDFLSGVKSIGYDIEATYFVDNIQREKLNLNITSGTYRNISEVQYNATDKLYVGEWQVDKIKILLDSRLDITKLENETKFILESDSNLDYDIANSLFVEEDKGYSTTINKNQIQGDKGSHYVELPIKIKIKEVYLNSRYVDLRDTIYQSSNDQNHNFTYDFKTNITYLNPNVEGLSSHIKYAGVVIDTNTSNYVTYQNDKEFIYDYDKIQANSTLNFFDKHLFSVNVIESWKKKSGAYEFTNSNNVLDLKENLKIQLELTLPQNVTWKGNSHYYDESSRKVVVNISDYEVESFGNYSLLLFGKISMMDMILNNLTIDGSEDNQIATTIPYKLTGSYKNAQLSKKESNLVIKSNKLGANLEDLSSNPKQVERNTQGQSVILQGTFDAFNMNFENSVKLSYEVDDTFADLKEVKLNTQYHIDNQFGERWSIQYTERVENNDIVKTISRNDFITSGISSENGRITKFSIVSDIFKLRSHSLNSTGMFNLKFDVLSTNRYTKEDIVVGDKIKIKPYSEFNNIKKDFSECYINIVGDKRASIIVDKMHGNNGNTSDVFVENTNSIFGYWFGLDNFDNLKDEDGLIENQSITINFSNTDKFQVKKFALAKDRDDEQVIDVKFTTNLKEYNETILFDSTLSNGAFSNKILKVDNSDAEYITSITLTTDIKKINSYWTFLNKISFEVGILDTDYINLNDSPQEIEFFALKEEQTDYLNIASASQKIKVISQELKFHDRSRLSKSSFTTDLDKKTVARGNNFKVSKALNLYSQWTYGDLEKKLYVYHDTYNNFGIDEKKLLAPYQNGNGYEYERTLDKEFLKYSIINPVIYIPLADGFEYVEESFIIKDQKYSNKKPKVSIIRDDSNNKYIKVQFYGDRDDDTSLFIDDFSVAEQQNDDYYSNEVWLKTLNIEYDLSTTILTPLGNNDISSKENKIYVDYITGYESYAKKLLGKDSNVSKVYPSSISEKKTFNGESVSYVFASTNENKSIVVSGESIVSVDTLVEKDNQLKNILNVYSGENYNIVTAIANGTKSDVVKEAFIYIPIKNIEANSDYQWDFKLTDAASFSGTNARISYSTQKNPSMNYTSSEEEYKENVSNWGDVTCIKISVERLDPLKQTSVKIPVSNVKKTETGKKVNHVKAYYRYLQNSTPIKSNTKDTYVNLLDTVITGKAWNDANMNGILDFNEVGISNLDITYYPNDGSENKTIQTTSDGNYRITLPEMSNSAALKITIPEGKNLVPEFYDNVNDSKVSHFDRETKTVRLQLGNTSNINAGLYTLQPITTQKDVYDVYIGRDATNIGASYSPDSPVQTLRYLVGEDYKKFLNVDSKGNMEGRITADNIPVEVYYVNSFGDRVSKNIQVNVKADSPLDLTIEKEVVGELGDRTKKFTIELSAQDRKGKPINKTFTCEGAGDIKNIEFQNGKAEIKLAHTEKIIIKDLPYGSQITVAEKKVDGYTVAYSINKGKNQESATLSLTNDSEVKVINTKTDIPDTGIFHNPTGTGILIFIGILGIVFVGISVFRKRKGLQ